MKGFLGAGAINRGTMNDEDFPGDVAYSNTLQSSSGSIGYGTIDLGYAFLRAPGARVGVFAGYNYYHQHVNTYGCAQLAGDEVCVPAGFVPANVVALAEDDRFNSLRLGVSAQVMLTDRLKLTAEAAYLPWANFKGRDDHNLRQLLVPEASASGNGVMLEGILGYDITDAWNVGIGGRYWAWNMRPGECVQFPGFEHAADISAGALHQRALRHVRADELSMGRQQRGRGNAPGQRRAGAGGGDGLERLLSRWAPRRRTKQ